MGRVGSGWGVKVRVWNFIGGYYDFLGIMRVWIKVKVVGKNEWMKRWFVSRI